jgi:hypothetical protein
MIKNADAGNINRDLATGATDVNSSPLYNPTARPCKAHESGDNQQREYDAGAPPKGKLGAIGQAGN